MPQAPLDWNPTLMPQMQISVDPAYLYHPQNQVNVKEQEEHDD